MLCRLYRRFFKARGLPTPSAAAYQLSLAGDDRWRAAIDRIFAKRGQVDHCKKAWEREQADA